MIGWKCKWGYYTEEGRNEPTSLNILDDSGWIGFLDKLDILVDTTNKAHSTLRSAYVHKGNSSFIISAIDSAAGQDNVLTTPVVVTGYNSQYATDTMHSTFPCFKKMAPNTFNIFKTPKDASGKYLGCYIPSLHRYIYFDKSSGGFSYAAADAVGSTWTSSYEGYFPFGIMFNSGNIIAYVGDISPEELLKPSNYLSFCILDNEGYYVSSFTWSHHPVLDSLFGSNYVPPDYNTPDNPYEPGGPSAPGDLPPGTFDDESDPIPDSSLPTISSANTGFTRIYNPTLSQVQALASYLWTTPDVIETIWNHIKQFFENPMEAMIGFNLVPVPVPDGGTTNFKLMYIDTGVQMTAAASQFVDRDCGTLKIERYYGSALDQSPYTKISCFLPYIGTVQLNTDEVMGTTLQVKYRVDICSGSCVAKIFVDGSCLYQYSGHCAIPIPFSAADFSSYVSAAVSVAKLAIGAAAAGAAGVAAGAIPTAAQQTNQVITQATVSAPGSNLPALIPTRSQITEPPSDQSSTEASFSGISPTSISNTVGEIMTSKPHVEHSGSFSGNTGYLGIRRPYVIIERPNMCMPAQYQHFNGFPAMISMELGTCKGYTRIQQVQLTGMTATNPEQAEILELLKSGVVF